MSAIYWSIGSSKTDKMNVHYRQHEVGKKKPPIGYQFDVPHSGSMWEKFS